MPAKLFTAAASHGVHWESAASTICEISIQTLIKLSCCALQEQLQDQVQTIQKLEDTVRQQAEDLNWTQSQLISTQGSLIDLETHLTTLEDQQANEASLQQSSPSATPTISRVTQPSVNSASQKLSLREDLAPNTPGQGSDPVQSAFVSSIDSIFPPSGGDDEAGDMPDLPEDPLELFERGKAAVQARAANQSTSSANMPELREDPYELFEKGKAAVEARASQQNKKNLPTGKQQRRST